MTLRRHRRALGSLILGAWLFALFVGVVNACVISAGSASQGSGLALEPDHEGGQGLSANCLQLCNDESPLLSKPQLVPDQAAAQALLVATLTVLPWPTSASIVTVVHLAHPPPDVPPLRRSLRLAL